MYLDPDFRRNVKEPSKPYCVRCQKNINDLSKSVSVTVNWDTWDVVEGGNELLGKDCWKIIQENK